MPAPTRPFRKLLVANRGEIAIRVLRAASELDLRTVAIYTHEDRYSLHRYKADESYQIGAPDDPLKPYLDVEGILACAKSCGAEAIHPGYGFLSESLELATRCREEGLVFIGPSPEAMAQMGDKRRTKELARRCDVPVIEDSDGTIDDFAAARAQADRIGYPIMVKAAAGGGGRGMRVVREGSGLEQAYTEAASEALRAFGDGAVFLERYVERPKHIEVQLIGDTHGNLVHLYERDCSVQRRFQKVVEVAPATTLPESVKQKLYDYALRLGREAGYSCAGTVEFLVDPEYKVYFIEVNPRIQVEHTITEEITGIDIVRSQLLICMGHRLTDDQLRMYPQEAIPLHGVAIQCRVTTEDPAAGFKPDYGTLTAYRSAAGFGIRLDAGSAYPGAVISPFFDSLLVKVTAAGRTLPGAAQRLHRALREFRVRGVKTNIDFLLNLLREPDFLAGAYTVAYFDEHPQLFDLPLRRDRGTKVLRYLADVIVNGNDSVRGRVGARDWRMPVVPVVGAGKGNAIDAIGAQGSQGQDEAESPVASPSRPLRSGGGNAIDAIEAQGSQGQGLGDPSVVPVASPLRPLRSKSSPSIPSPSESSPPEPTLRSILLSRGARAFAKTVQADPRLHYTDTTFRDAHQSLLATRMRTKDLLDVAAAYDRDHGRDLFSIEMWGGATFDVCLRFLREDPWQRLRLLRAAMPSVPFQMLLRGSNGVGYKAYPDNLVEAFIERSAYEGIDVFRIFDSLNWVDNLRPAIRCVAERTHAVAEAAICYTGDLSDPREDKYTLDYYLALARQLEDAGAHVLAIKDMAGLLKPRAAELLIPALRGAVDLPIHLHTHDTSSIQAATYLSAVNAGVDVIDCALAAMSGLTSQPNLNSVVAMLAGTARARAIDLDSLNRHSQYWEAVRTYYRPFETELRAGTAEVYDTEIPGGQYSNLRPQARGLGLEHRFEDVKRNYALADRLLGRLVKVTPSSKVVGDLALFITSNDLTEAQLLDPDNTLSWPDSVRQLMRGDLGQAPGGFPAALQRAVLQGETPYTERPNARLAPIDFAAEAEAFAKTYPDRFGPQPLAPAPPRGRDHPAAHGQPVDPHGPAPAQAPPRLVDAQLLSHLLYPEVFREYVEFTDTFGDVTPLPTSAFFYGLAPNEEIEVELERGKTIVVKYLSRTVTSDTGEVLVLFRLNGQTRSEVAQDRSAQIEVVRNRRAERPGEVGAPLQGAVSRVLVEVGDSVEAGDPLFVLEAMKMESTVTAPSPGTVTEVALGAKALVQVGDLVVAIEPVPA